MIIFCRGYRFDLDESTKQCEVSYHPALSKNAIDDYLFSIKMGRGVASPMAEVFCDIAKFFSVKSLVSMHIASNKSVIAYASRDGLSSINKKEFEYYLRGDPKEYFALYLKTLKPGDGEKLASTLKETLPPTVKTIFLKFKTVSEVLYQEMITFASNLPAGMTINLSYFDNYLEFSKDQYLSDFIKALPKNTVLILPDSIFRIEASLSKLGYRLSENVPVFFDTLFGSFAEYRGAWLFETLFHPCVKMSKLILYPQSLKTISSEQLAKLLFCILYLDLYDDEIAAIFQEKSPQLMENLFSEFKFISKMFERPVFNAVNRDYYAEASSPFYSLIHLVANTIQVKVERKVQNKRFDFSAIKLRSLIIDEKWLSLLVSELEQENTPLALFTAALLLADFIPVQLNKMPIFDSYNKRDLNDYYTKRRQLAIQFLVRVAEVDESWLEPCNALLWSLKLEDTATCIQEQLDAIPWLRPENIIINEHLNAFEGHEVFYPQNYNPPLSSFFLKRVLNGLIQPEKKVLRAT